jgi:hypothetical protein
VIANLPKMFKNIIFVAMLKIKWLTTTTAKSASIIDLEIKRMLKNEF